MKKKKLIRITSKEKISQFCHHCDRNMHEVKVFYKELMDDGFHFKRATYLDCCLDKIGVVIDDYCWEKYNEITESDDHNGVPIHRIFGYKKL